MSIPALATLSVTFIAAFLFLLVGHPIWSIIDCAVTEQYSKTKKIVWIVIMLLTWYLSSFFYGIFVTQSRSLRMVTMLSLLLFVVGLGYLVRYGHHTTKTYTVNTGSKANTSIAHKPHLKPAGKPLHHYGTPHGTPHGR